MPPKLNSKHASRAEFYFRLQFRHLFCYETRQVSPSERFLTELLFSRVMEVEGPLQADNVLGVVEEDRVPREVRDWLTITFTHTATTNTPKRLSDEKQLKFRSVAHAIRAGIVVDRLTLLLHTDMRIA